MSTALKAGGTVLLRGTQSYAFDYGRLTPREKETLLRRSKFVIFFTESSLLRGIVSYGIDATNQVLSVNFIPDRWIPRFRVPLTQENVDSAIRDAIRRAEKIDVTARRGL